MAHDTQLCVFALVTTLLVLSQFPKSQARVEKSNGEKTAVFLSPRFEMGPGSVVEKYYYNIDFPKGHIAVKSFDAEVVDEKGNSVPLHETYLHHWVINRYYQRKGLEIPKHDGNIGFYTSDRLQVRNSGLCERTLGQYYGLGSETRRTLTHVPDPYGIEVGNPSEIPEGYEEVWMLNVHAIDTRGVENALGCTECKCDLYNVTVRENGQPLSPNYIGGLQCCYDETQCRLREGLEGVQKRGLYMRYTVKWVDWDESLVPVRIYILDVTDLFGNGHRCEVEYKVESCSSESNNGCIDSKRVSINMPIGGKVIYGVAHQHTGGLGSTLYGQDGRVICSSLPTYGKGKEAGDEQGYIVGMSTCYPNPGSVKIYDRETLLLESNYSSDQLHTGVMGLFYLLLADEKSPDSNSLLSALVKVCLKSKANEDKWFLDSGCSRHMTGDESKFTILKPKNGGYVTFGDNSKGKITGIGSIGIAPYPTIENVILVSGLKHNLLSISQLCDKGFKVIFEKDQCTAHDIHNDKILLKGHRHENVYMFDLKSASNDNVKCLAAIGDSSWLWHRRLAHANMDLISKLSRKELVIGLSKIAFSKDRLCHACQLGKQTRVSFHAKNIICTKRCLELIHMDLFGPFRTLSLGGKAYALVMVDDFSRYTWVIFLSHKDHAFHEFSTLCKMLQNTKGFIITSIRPITAKSLRIPHFKLIAKITESYIIFPLLGLHNKMEL